MRRSVAALALALLLVPVLGASAQANDIVDTGITQKVQCMFRQYVQEGGESGLDCLT